MTEGEARLGGTSDRERRFVSIGTKLGLAVVLVVTLATALTFVWFSRRERDALVDSKRKAAEMVADLFAASLGAPLDFGDEDAVKSEIDNLKQNRDVTFAAVWPLEAREPMAMYAAGGESTAPLQEPGTRVLLDRVEVGRTVTGGSGKPVGNLLVHFSLAPENAAYRQNRTRMLWLCLLFAVGSMGVLLIVSRSQVVLPIERLLRAVRRIEKGERKVRVDVASNDEIGRLGRAFEEMNVAIADRELRLAEVNRSLRELFDHMRQAIVVFDREGRVVGAQSRQAEVVFGHPELRGERVRELLYPGAGSWDAELRAFDEWVEVAFQARAEDWDALASLAPPAVRLHDGGERVLTLEFRPILVDDEIDRIMLLATDITQQKMLERQVVLQGERHARQMAAMRRLVSGGGQQFVGFLDAARERLDRALELATSTEELPLAELNEVFGQVHTLRAEAKSFGLDELAGHVTGIEERLGLLRAGAIAAGSGVVASRDAELAAEVKSARELVDDAERLFVEASPIGRAVLEQVNVRRPDLTRLCELALAQGGEIGALAERLSARTLGELAAAVGERASSWADAVAKRARVDVDGREVLVPERLARVLGGVLTHLVRNSIAHGIERPEERERLGKPVVGSVRIRGCQGSGAALTPTIEVEDDGRGFADNPLLSELAARRGPLEVSDGRHGSFRPVPAQAATELEGRGIGLAAIVRDLEAVGYRLQVSTTDSGGARFSLVPARSAAGRGAA